MISDKLYASTVSNLSSLYLYCKEIKIKNLEHSKNSPLLVLSPPLSPLTAKQSVFLCIQVRGNSQTKRSGVRLCTGAAHNFYISVPPYGCVMLAHFPCVRLLLLHFTKPILRKNLTALQSTFPTPPPPPKKMNKRYCVPSNKSQSQFQNNSSKWKHDWTCLGNNGFLTLKVTWDVQNVKKVFYFQKKKKQISRLHIHHQVQQT